MVSAALAAYDKLFRRAQMPRLDLLISFGIAILLLRMIYKLVPSATIARRNG